MSAIKIKNLNDKKQWEKFVSAQDEANFLQSYNWGLFQAKIGKKFFPLGIFEREAQVGAAMVIKEEAKRGDYLTIAGGPLLAWDDEHIQDLFKVFVTYLKKLAKQEGCHFVRIRPQALDTLSIRKVFAKAGLKPAPMHLTADLTLQLDLNQADDELLMQMRKNTRYYIRRAKRDGVTTQVLTDPDFMEQFHRYQLYLADKHNFVPFSFKFLKEQFETFLVDGQVAFVNSYMEDKLLASAFIIFYNQKAVYHYGVSTPDNDDWPGSYAIQWAAIQEAKKRNCSIYNFWGIAPEDKPDHRFAGVSLFKRGFGGKEVPYLPAYDLGVTPFYWLTRGFELIRKKIRGL